jgi:HK97 family phage major capsid protein
VFDTSPIRQIANVVTIGTDALEGVRDTDEAASGWVSEMGSRAETNTPQLGAWRIAVHELYANPRATQKLLDDANIDAEAWLAGKIADKFSRDQNAAFVNGNGVGRPQGFCAYATAATADSSRAWGTLEHVGTGVNGDFAASTPADIMFDLISRFKPHYLSDATFVTNRAVLARIRKFKESTTNAYIWQPGLQAGTPDSLLGYPVNMAEDMPALASGSLSLALGNFKEGYQIVDRMGVRLLRDPFSSKPYVQFYTTCRVGGAVVQFESIKFIRFA